VLSNANTSGRNAINQKTHSYEAEAELLEEKLRSERSQLVEVDDLRHVIATVQTNLSQFLDALPDNIVTRLNLTTDHAPAIRELTNQLRDSMVNDLQQILPRDA
jgi:hypothetical protein